MIRKPLFSSTNSEVEVHRYDPALTGLTRWQVILVDVDKLRESPKMIQVSCTKLAGLTGELSSAQ